MLNRLVSVLVLSCAALAASAPPALAQQTLNFSFGYFTVRGEEVRPARDILLIQHHDLDFDISEFNGVTLGGEWLVPIGNYLEAGGGVSFARKTVPTVYRQSVVRGGSAIERDLDLRQMPVALTVRVLPLGQSYSVQPYVGGGIAVVRWRYRESGDFFLPNRTVVTEEHAATGNATGPLFVVGLRVAGDAIGFGFDARYQRASGSFGPSFARIQRPEIDLSGWTLQGTAGMRFGK